MEKLLNGRKKYYFYPINYLQQNFKKCREDEMNKVLENYFKNKKHVQLIIREKEMEGTIESIRDDLIHLIGEKYEYHIPIDKIVTVGCKLETKDRKKKDEKNPPLGFQLG
tara:strand:+ start:262 stop:591 length:330 start_codon:yes stop_codon:yes gene_type:complete